jgi:choice-of-anchor B domain-containing protein
MKQLNSLRIFVLRIFAIYAFLQFFPFALLSQPCINGFSGPYPCEKVDQLAELTCAQLGVEIPSDQRTNDIWGWTSAETGREYALVGMHERTAFVEVTSPEHPILLGFLPTATFGILWRDVKVIDHWAYIVSEAGGHGLQVFDLRRLEHLTYDEVPVQFDADAHYTGFGNSHNIVADTASKFVYAVGTNTFAGGLHIVDVSDPLNPSYAGSSDEDGYTHDAQVVVYQGPDTEWQGRQICIASNTDAVTIFDVTNKDDVALISSSDYELVGYTHQGWLTEDHRFFIANDELDEMNFNINTRSIIFNVEDLDNPFVVDYVDLGTTSIDHNLYTHEGLVYASNYTSGLRILSAIDVAEGNLLPVGYFDVFPNGEPRIFHGSWSNYPYFESGTVVATSIYFGLHILKPNLWTLDRELIEVCGSNSATLFFDLNIPVAGQVNYNIEYFNGSGPQVLFEAASSNGAPFQNALVFQGLNGFAPGNYPGEVVISYDDFERRLPFVLMIQGGEALDVPTLVSPIAGQILPSQEVAFTWIDAAHGYVALEVATDADFSNIVYQKDLFGANGQFTAQLPFDLTYYYWRLIKPTPCGETLVSEVGGFQIDLVTSIDGVGGYSPTALELFPNPAQDYVNIVAPAGIQQLKVYDLAGRTVDTWQLKGSSAASSFNIASLAKGLYLVRDAEGLHTAKMVVR